MYLGAITWVSERVISFFCVRFCVTLVFFSSRRRHTMCALVTGVQTCALPISSDAGPDRKGRADADIVFRQGVLDSRRELRGAGRRGEIGRASCRERVCQYV